MDCELFLGVSSLIVVIDLLNSSRYGTGLTLRQLDNISDAVLLVCRCTWAEELSQPCAKILFIFPSINSRFFSYMDCFTVVVDLGRL